MLFKLLEIVLPPFGCSWRITALRPDRSIKLATCSFNNRWLMTAYLELTDDEWEAIRPILPVPKRGPKLPHDRAVCAAFLFCRAAGVSGRKPSTQLNSRPRSSCVRPGGDMGTATACWPRLFAAGAKAEKRMEKQYDDEILRRTVERARGHRQGDGNDATMDFEC